MPVSFLCLLSFTYSFYSSLLSLFCYPSQFHHRDPGIVGLLTSLEVTDQVYYGLISDGHHTHETVQRIAHQANSDGKKLNLVPFYIIDV